MVITVKKQPTHVAIGFLHCTNNLPMCLDALGLSTNNLPMHKGGSTSSQTTCPYVKVALFLHKQHAYVLKCF